MPLLCTLSFHSLSLLISYSSVSAITAKSSAYSSSHGRATLNSLDMASMTITNNSGLNPEPWCIPTFTSKPLLLPQTVLTTVFAPAFSNYISGKSGPKDQVALHYYYTSPSHWCTTDEVSKLLISQRLLHYRDGISRYSVPPNAGPLLPLDITADTSHSSSPSLRIAQLMTSFITLFLLLGPLCKFSMTQQGLSQLHWPYD